MRAAPQALLMRLPAGPAVNCNRQLVDELLQGTTQCPYGSHMSMARLDLEAWMLHMHDEHVQTPSGTSLVMLLCYLLNKK